ncbi:unnamed protein product [Tuber aestivum]|uniref:Ketoreductase domain-containing protein n=1 Tax=Tuber aestivum TaxID=59557 RepID=A0A292PPX9_9PEZI|nr:unnamed protein product [Tuber aestivum]
MPSMFDLSGKTALVTGGSRGIGQTMALALAEAGADIILVQRDSKNISTKAQIAAMGRACTIVNADLSSDAEVSALVPGLVADPSSLPNQRIDILLNCAGIQRRHPSHQFPTKDFQAVIQVNLATVFTICRDIGAYFIGNQIHGRIINVASLLSFQGGLTVSAYAASKGAVLQLTKALSNEWAGKGIGVNAIAPGYIATEMNEALMKDETRNRQIMERIPAGRWGRPEDFKGPVVFLASEKASGYVSGECLVVDGGWMGR